MVRIQSSLTFIFLLVAYSGLGQPITEEWLQKSMREASPRLVFTKTLEDQVKARMNEYALAADFYQLLKTRADAILEEKPLTYTKKGRRLLSVSREAVRRMTALALVARIEKDDKYIQRLEKSLTTVCEFPDWNPSHFLDVAEMATAVSLAIDWCGGMLSPEIFDKASQTLVSHALKPGLAVSQNNWWIDKHHNWNLVCHGGLAIAALAVFEREPEISSSILNRSLEKIPLGLEPYAPDGIYPEGPSYWGYATNYLAIISACFQSAVNKDFNLSKAKGLLESAEVSRLIAGPSGLYYNFFDAGTNGYQSLQHFGLLAWFEQLGAPAFNKQDFRKEIAAQLESPTDNTRFLALYFLYFNQLNQNSGVVELPFNWVGEGDIPIGVFRPTDPNGLYLAAKGGRAADNHGNMDAGSFILEWQKERFGVDMGNQSYKELEDIIGTTGLWNESQNSPRWDLLTKNNFGHSALTINGLRHNADARARLIENKLSVKIPYFTFDLSLLYGGYLGSAQRTFSKVSDNKVRVTDALTFAPATQTITWQMLTQAEVSPKGKEIVLTQNEKRIRLEIQNPEDFEVQIVSLSPPPLSYDKNMEALKRIDIVFNRKDFATNQASINILIEGIP